MLWFAWKIVLLQYRKQPGLLQQSRVFCCDLLEKSYFCSIANNSSHYMTLPSSLWFAWKIVLLQYRKQPWSMRLYTFCSCDLLEKSYFCSIANNYSLVQRRSQRVVICLKNRTFAVSQTTRTSHDTRTMGLWFAWKIVLLQYRKQLVPRLTFADPSCDLLEKSYFCSIANNYQ